MPHCRVRVDAITRAGTRGLLLLERTSHHATDTAVVGCRNRTEGGHASGSPRTPADARMQVSTPRVRDAPACRHLQGATRRPPARCRNGRPGVARSHECRDGATGSCRTDSETRKFRKRVSARCAAQTRNARQARMPMASRRRTTSQRPLRRPIRAQHVHGGRRRDARRAIKAGPERLGVWVPTDVNRGTARFGPGV